MAKRWCVAWLERDAQGFPTGSRRWCAVKGRKPAETATAVETRCGFVVTLPCGTERREPDCGDCCASEKSASPS